MKAQDPAWDGGALANQSVDHESTIELSDIAEPDEPSSPAPTDPIMLSAASVPTEPSSPPPDASDGFPIDINERWRIAFDPLQWILQRRRGTEWRDRSFCVTREGLLRCIREYIGDIGLPALERVHALPEWHPDRTRGVR